jgi:pimeloyl-ACP methyl ester carboxylesterase
VRKIKPDLSALAVFAAVLLAAGCGNDGNPPVMDMADPAPDDLLIPPVTPPGCTATTCFMDYFGQQIYYKRMGPTTGKKVVLLSGAVFDDAEQWRFVQPVIAQKYDVVSFDYLGFARSAHPMGRVSMITQAEVAIALMDKLQFTKAHVVGFSLGGTVAQTLGKTPQYRDRIESISLLNGVGIMTPTNPPNFPSLSTVMFSNLPTTGYDGTRAFVEVVNYHDNTITDELVKDIIKLHLHYNADIAYDVQLFDGFSYGMGLTFPNEYGAFTGIPFGVIETENDEHQYTKDWTDAYKNITNATITPMIPSCGHNVLVDCPSATAKAVMEWLDAH